MSPLESDTLSLARSRAKRTTSRFVNVLGVDVHLLDEGPSGETAGPDVVLLSAQWLSAFSFDRWAEIISERHRVVRVDLPGQGLSGSFPDEDYSPYRYAALLDAVIEAVVSGPYVLVGSSFSGIVAAIHAANRPKGLRGLVLATSSGLPRKTNSPAPNAAPPDPAWAADDAHRPRAFYDWKLGTLLCRPMDAAARQALLDEVAAMNELPGRAMEARLRLAHHDADALSKALPHVAVPVLIQWSSDSLYLPSEQAERIGALTGGLACVRHYPGTGHLLLIDAAAECARDLLLFLETLS